MWTAAKVKNAIRMHKTGYSTEDIAEHFKETKTEVQELLRCTIPQYLSPIPQGLYVSDPKREIQNLIKYIPQAPPFFKDIAIQRLKQLC